MAERSKVKFSHETAEAASVRKSYSDGWVFAAISTAEALTSKEKPEMPGVQYKMAKVNWKPLRDQADVNSGVGRGIQDYWCLPFWDEAWDDLDYTFTKKDGSEVPIQEKLTENINTFAQMNRNRLAALFPEEVPNGPRKDKTTGSLMYNGEEIAAEDYKEKSVESIYTAGNKAEEFWNDGVEPLIERGCYIRVAYEEGSDFPSVKGYSAEPPIDFKTGELIPVLTGDQIMGGRKTEEVVEEGEPAPAPVSKKANGSNGKGAFNPPKKASKKPSGRARA